LGEEFIGSPKCKGHYKKKVTIIVSHQGNSTDKIIQNCTHK